jgi:diguanylate cyclase (GGDEF)-like protein
MHLDFLTILLLQILAATISGAVLASAWNSADLRGQREATLAMGSLAVGLVAMTRRDAMSPYIAVLGANVLYWLSAALIHRAIVRAVGERSPARWPFAVVGAGALVFVGLIARGNAYGLRVLVSSAILLVLASASVVELARDRGLRREPARRFLFGLMGVGVVGLFIRIVVVLPRWDMPTRPPLTDLQIGLAHLPGLLLAQGFGMAFMLWHAQRVAARALEAATTDALTGCANRRSLEAQVQVELAHAARKGRACALVIADLDHFKRVNDAHGHSAGDAVLHEAARALKASVRPGDVVARYGGEEFCVLLREADVDLAVIVAERLCRALRALRFEVGGEVVPVRASFGVAGTGVASSESWESLFRRADAALYRAKEQGRDRVVADR